MTAAQFLENKKLDHQLILMAQQMFPNDARMMFLVKEKTASLLTGGTTKQEEMLTVSEIMQKIFPIGEVLKKRISVGRHVAQKYRNEFGEPPLTTEKLVNGHRCSIKVYSGEKIEIVRTWIREYLG